MGGSIEDEDGNNSRFIDFSEVEWKKSHGDPVDKPKGQKWVEYPPAKEKYGYKKTDGTVINAFGKWQNENIKDSKELLEKTYDQLVNVASQIQTNYALDVELSSDPAELGDTGLALDRTVAEPIEFSGRIIALEYSISDPEGTAKVEMGQFLSVYEPDTRIDEIEDRIRDIERDRDIVVDDNSFPDIKPPTPQKVEVKGLFASVALLWEFDSSSYIAAYEVYGSQVKDFAPDTTNFSNRLWRGKEGGWVHDSDVNQVWYYRIRAVNTRGTASDFTAQFSATTVRIGTNHIENQSITNALIKDLSADKISVGTLVGINIKGSILTGSRLEFTDPDPYNVSYVTGSEIFMRRRDPSDDTLFSFFNVKEGKITTKGGKISGSSSTISIQRGELIATSTYNDYGIKLSAPEGEYGGTKLEFFSGDPSNSNDSIGWMGVQGSHLSISTLNNRSLFVSMQNIRISTGYLRLDGPTGDGTNASAVFNVNDQQNYVDLSSIGNVGVRIFGGQRGLNLYGVNYISGFGGGKTIRFENSGEVLLTDTRSNTDFHIGRDSTGPRIYSNAIYKRTYSSAANLYITGAGTLGRVTSASKYKMNIEDLPSDRYEKVLDLIPKTWYDKQAVEEYSKALSEGNEEVALNENDIPHVERIPGLIAEDVYNAGLKEFVSFGPPDANGNREIEGLMYDRIYVLLIPLVKNLKKRIEILESGLN
nr:hypothetical protein [Bacillus pumilus]